MRALLRTDAKKRIYQPYVICSYSGQTVVSTVAINFYLLFFDWIVNYAPARTLALIDSYPCVHEAYINLYV